MHPSTVLVYAGRGSSHSWTWTADLLESARTYDSEFVDEHGLVRALDEGASAVVVSGGDGHEIASALAPKGFAAVERHVRGGGSYIGVCAGAYLPLPSRVEPFDRFNLSSTRIRNIVAGANYEAVSSPRTGVRYGSCSIVHPVRGEVELGDGSRVLRAPIYGGPVFQEPSADSVVLRYSAFTPGTSFLMDRSRASEMMLGAPAVVSCDLDRGTMVLAGPHLEYPGCTEANQVFLRLARLAPMAPASVTGPRPRRSVPALDRSLADLKVAVTGMERESFLVGAKLWDGGRMLELAEAIAKRKDSLDDDTAQAVVDTVDRAREELLSVGPEKVAYSDSAPALLVEASRLAVNRHFDVMKG